MRYRAVAEGRVVDTSFHAWHPWDEEATGKLNIQFPTADGDILYRRTVNGGLFRRNTADSIRAWQGRLVTVFYDRRNPKRASTDLWADIRFGLLICGIGVLLYLSVVQPDVTFTSPLERLLQ